VTSTFVPVVTAGGAASAVAEPAVTGIVTEVPRTAAEPVAKVAGDTIELETLGSPAEALALAGVLVTERDSEIETGGAGAEAFAMPAEAPRLVEI
jgi:hypothetical protein